MVTPLAPITHPGSKRGATVHQFMSGHRHSWRHVSAAMGLLVLTEASPVTAQQVVSPPVPEPARHTALPGNGDESAWPELRNLITTLENLSTPVDPDDLAAILGLNKATFNLSNKFGYFGDVRNKKNSNINNIYETPINSGDHIYIHLSIAQFSYKLRNYDYNYQLILFDAKPFNISCIHFSSIRDDLAKFRWDGIPPTNPLQYGPNPPLTLPYYKISLGAPSFENESITIEFTKPDKCLVQVSGFVKIRKV